MRARAEAEVLAIGRRSRGRAAVPVEEEADGWGYPVSVCVRERGRGRALSGCGPEVRMWAGLRPSFQAVHCAMLFSFSFMQFMIYMFEIML